MFNEFTFSLPTQVVYGNGVLSQAGEIAKGLGAKKVLLVADKGVRATGLTDKVTQSLKSEGLNVVDFDQIVANPRVTDCEAGAAFGKSEKVDLVVTVGGGSSIDSAKAIAGMLGNDTLSFADIQYPNAYEKPALPLIAIPTTAGTGSEITPFAVITDEKTHTKIFCADEKVTPTVAIADPEVLMGLPASIAAATGVDALTHAIEGYVAQCTNPITEAMGLYAIKLIHSNLRKYIYQRDINICGAMMTGSLIAGISFGFSDTASVHSLSEVIGGQYDTPHGVANAIFLADVTEFSIPGNMSKYVDVANALGIKGEGLSDRETAQAGVEEIRLLVKDLMIPKFSEVDNVNKDDFRMLAKRCEEHMSNADNPRPLTEDDFYNILLNAYER